VTPWPPGGSPRDNLSRFDDHLRYISTALFGAGMLAVLLVANFDLVLPHAIDRVALNLIVGAAGLSVAGILLFPWRRYHRNLFLVAILDGLGLIALAVYFSGGWESPFSFRSLSVLFLRGGLLRHLRPSPDAVSCFLDGVDEVLRALRCLRCPS
jgi:hypothetical protein